MIAIRAEIDRVGERRMAAPTTTRCTTLRITADDV